MTEFTLYVGYPHTSSWSMRGWLTMRKTRAPFREEMIRYRLPDHKRRLAAVSPSAKVPLLVHERAGRTVKVWDSLAIGEYLAELFPERRLWPEDLVARATARAISAEMHSGFRALRDRLSMDLLARIPGVTMDEPVREDIRRIEAMWSETRREFGDGGPFLFGAFTIADAMYAPVATRFRTYGVRLAPAAEEYAQALLADSDVQEWERKARGMAPPEPLPA